MNRVRQMLIAGLLLLTLAGCQFSGNALVDADQVSWDGQSSIALEPGQPVGQTFVARHGGLAGVEFFLMPALPSARSLTLHVRSNPQAETDLVTATLQLLPGAEPGFYRFAFSPLEASHGQYYYAFLEGIEPGTSLALGPGEAYLDGAAYQDHRPLETQTAFRLVYAPRYLALDLLRAVWGWLGLLGAAIMLFVVPGWALLAWLLPGRRLSWAETLGLAVGISLALYPLLFLWTDLIGLHLGALYAWLPAVSGAAALLWRYRSRLLSHPARWHPRLGKEKLGAWARSEALWPDLALIALLGLVFGVRLLVVRSLDAPMWGDSYQHTMIVQLLVDNKGLFDSWLPYTAIDRFTYHFGFHSATATLHWLTGLPPIQATLWAGQLLNGLAVLAIYPLAVRVTGSRWGGVWAVLLAGLLSPMPMFYTNWGRYTQLAGQAILPAACWLAWKVVEVPQLPWRLLPLAALVAGGLALTHYRVMAFYAIWVLALALLFLRHGTWRKVLSQLGSVGLGAGLLFLPWFIHTFEGNMVRIFGRHLTALPTQVTPFVLEYNTMGSLETYLAPVWWLALGLGLGVGLWRRQCGVLLAGLWGFLLLIATNPAWLSLPGTGVISNFALFIAAYLPAGLLSGVLVAHLARPVAGRARASTLILLGVVLLGVWGSRERLADLQPARHALVTRPDVQAAGWIRENTPPEARFLVNSFFAYGNSLIVGSDGGWWLPLLAGRQNTVPPLNYGSELRAGTGYRQQVEELARRIQAHGPADPAVVDLLRQQGVTHVYIGQRQGRVNYDGPGVLAPEILLNSPTYNLVYHQDRVWIFELKTAR